MNNIITLDKLDIDKSAKILYINDNLELKNRLEELGIIKGNIIKCELISPFHNPKAYLIKESLIAIRNEDAINIKVITSE